MKAVQTKAARSNHSEMKAVLEAKLAELAKPLRERDDLATEATGDIVDIMQALNVRAMAADRVSQKSQLIADIRAALKRLADGSYGTCAECDEPIPTRRLQAIPWAVCCVRCQEAIETESGANRDVEMPAAA